MIQELTDRMGLSWPETRTTNAPAGGGIYEYSESGRQFIERIQAFPFAVMEFAEVRSENWGLVNSAFEVRVNFHYVDRYPAPNISRLVLTTLRERLDQFRHDLIAQGGQLTTATVLDCEGFDWSGTDPATAIFFQKNEALLSGFVTFTFVFGETV